MKLLLRSISTAAALAVLFVMPVFASAASISFSTLPGAVAVGDTVVVQAYLDTGTQSVNVVDGTLDIKGAVSGFAVAKVSLAGSALTLWPRTPSLSTDGQAISFTGGIPNGLQSGHALLFTIAIDTRAPGDITLSPGSITALLNDGKGTPLSLAGSALTIMVAPAVQGAPVRDELQEIVGTDTTPPAAFTVEAGQDPMTYDGKEFITFQTTDSQSGIDHYEVKEGDAAPVRSSSPYILQRQGVPETITVYAYDEAGNVRTSTYDTRGEASSSALSWVIIAGVFVLCLFAAGRILRPRRPRNR